MCAAHLHGVGQLAAYLVDVEADPLLAAAVDRGDEGPGDQHPRRPHGQRLEYVGAAADAAVHQHRRAAAPQGRDDLGQDLGGGGALVQHAAAMVGDHDGRRAGFLRFERSFDRHDPLDDEGLVEDAGDLTQLGGALAAGRRVAVLQKGQAGGVHIHRHRKAAALFGLRHLGPDGAHIPRLDGGHPAACRRRDGPGGLGHDVGVGAVPGEGRDPPRRAGADQHIVVAHVVVGVRIVQVDRPHRPRKEGVAEGAPEQLAAGVRLAAGAEGIHIQPDLRPLVVVADGGVPRPLGPRAGDAVAAGAPVADQAGAAALAQRFAGAAQQVVVSHGTSSLFPLCSAPIIRRPGRRVKRRKIFQKSLDKSQQFRYYYGAPCEAPKTRSDGKMAELV